MPDTSDDLFTLGEPLRADGLVVRTAADFRGEKIEARTLDVPDRVANVALLEGDADAAKAAGLPAELCVPVLAFVGRQPPLVLAPRPGGWRLPVRLADRDFSGREILWMALDVARALAAGHALELAHGAVRPEAIVVAEDGTARLDDWVIGKALSRVGQTDEKTMRATARFGSPEMVGGDGASPEGDVFAWASTFYEALTSGPAFDGDTPIAMLTSVSRARVPDLDPIMEIDPGLPALFRKAWKKQAAKRATAEDLVKGLVAILGEPDPRKPAPKEERPAIPRVEPPSGASPIDPLDVSTMRSMAIPNHVPERVDAVRAAEPPMVGAPPRIDPTHVPREPAPRAAPSAVGAAPPARVAMGEDAPTVRGLTLGELLGDGDENETTSKRVAPPPNDYGEIMRTAVLRMPDLAPPPPAGPVSVEPTEEAPPSPLAGVRPELLWVAGGVIALVIVLFTALIVVWLAG